MRRGCLRGLLKLLLTTKYRYSRELFIGEIEAKEDLRYIGNDAIIQDDGTVISGDILINKGELYNFKSLFIDHEITVDFLGGGGKNIENLFWKDREYRIGYFESTWRRPSMYNASQDNYNDLTLNNNDFYDTIYRAKGVIFLFSTLNRAKEGFNWEAFLKRSLSAEIKNAYGKKFLKNVEYVDYTSSSVKIWYNHYFEVNNSFEYLITIGGSYDFRHFELKEDENSGNSVDLDRDSIFRLHGSFGFKF
jgi:hypothetical protein